VDIVFKNKQLEKLCNDDRLAQKNWGKAQAAVLGRRLDDLRAAPSLEALRGLPGNLHELKGDRAGQLALDLKGGDRLIIEPAHEPPPTKPDGGLDWRQVTAVRIVEVVDYHD
jgi:plasmid maintenance system killer protein